ncbi:MAG: hypothetical protein ACI9RO_002208 [Alteromonas macleodii]|jgi:hypothetical protein
MTILGHDFLDGIREACVWESTKKRLGSECGWTLDVVLAVAKEELKLRLGLGLQGGYSYSHQQNRPPNKALHFNLVATRSNLKAVFGAANLKTAPKTLVLALL